MIAARERKDQKEIAVSGMSCEVRSVFPQFCFVAGDSFRLFREFRGH